MNHALIEKKKILAYLDDEIKRLSKFDLTKGGVTAGFAVAVIKIKSEIEEGTFDCTELVETTSKESTTRSFVLPAWPNTTDQYKIDYHGKPYVGGFDP